MKSEIDKVSTFLIDRPVKLLDAFRLGCKPDPSHTRPRPVLIKLGSCWDRRLLLASCRKLKGYTKSKLFLREDLPPDARSSRPRGKNGVSDKSVTPPVDQPVDSASNPNTVNLSAGISISENSHC